VLINHFEVVMLVMDVFWNMMRKCIGDLSSYNVEREYGDVSRFNARRCKEILHCRLLRMVIQ